MAELPDIRNYLNALDRFIVGQRLASLLIKSPFVLRTFEPDVQSCAGLEVTAVSRLGKRIVWHLSDDLFLVFHLMIAGRFHWRKPNTRPARKVDLAAFRFEHGTMLLTEASQKKRASLHVVRGQGGLEEHTRSGINVLTCSLDEFASQLRTRNRTLKRALVDPELFDGIGNAYSDEILHAAGLSPVRTTSRLNDTAIEKLFEAARETLLMWIDRLQEETGDKFPEKVTAFHPLMAVHGRFGEPCPACETNVQRIRYSTRELNYCPRCQTDGRVLKDRSLSRLLKDDWPSSID